MSAAGGPPAPAGEPELGARFEAEIREQPAVLRGLAERPCARDLAEAVRGRESTIVLVGSGSSLFVSMLGALALRRRGIRAVAIAATEAAFEAPAYERATVVALSQSGRSTDVLNAIDRLRPATLIALTNDGASPLAERAGLVIDVAAGPERAVPATKSVTSMVAVLLWSAAMLAPRVGRHGWRDRDAESLREVAASIEAWLADADAMREVREAAGLLAPRRSIAVVGAGYGVPIAFELALKIKEATYVHAEGFAAGEFRHGSVAMLDAATATIGIVDEASRAVVTRPLDAAAAAGALRYSIGAGVAGMPRLGPLAGEPFNTLAWLVTGQTLALEIGRARGVDGDAPRGLTKFVL